MVLLDYEINNDREMARSIIACFYIIIHEDLTDKLDEIKNLSL